MTAAPLNIFQKLIRQWERLHPYNAAQILKIRGPADPEALQGAWDGALSVGGLGRVCLNGSAFRYQPPDGPRDRVRVCVLPRGTPLHEHISADLNRPFVADESPFRPFVIDDDGFHHVGLVYRHWVADSVSIRQLLRQWFLRVYDPPQANGQLLRMPSGGYWRYFGGQRGGDVDQAATAALRRFARFRQASRIDVGGCYDLTTRFTTVAAPPRLLPHLLQTARARGTTLNDLFLAAMARACYRTIPRKAIRGRDHLALGSIVDLRRLDPDGLEDVFGLFLGFSNVILRPQDLNDPQRLVQVIAAQTAQEKTSGLTAASMIWMLAALGLGRIVRPQRIYHYYRKHVPLLGGISNINLNDTWAPLYHPSPLMQYLRAAPAGPLVPLVLTPTTLGDTFNIGLTYRTAILDDARAVRLARVFLDALTTAAFDDPAPPG